MNAAPPSAMSTLEMRRSKKHRATIRGWIIDILIGGIVGAIVALNIVIYSGIDEGYEAGIDDVFSQNLLVGIMTVTILTAGPVIGAITARLIRQRQGRAQHFDADKPDG